MAENASSSSTTPLPSTSTPPRHHHRAMNCSSFTSTPTTARLQGIIKNGNVDDEESITSEGGIVMRTAFSDEILHPTQTLLINEQEDFSQTLENDSSFISNIEKPSLRHHRQHRLRRTFPNHCYGSGRRTPNKPLLGNNLHAKSPTRNSGVNDDGDDGQQLSELPEVGSKLLRGGKPPKQLSNESRGMFVVGDQDSFTVTPVSNPDESAEIGQSATNASTRRRRPLSSGFAGRIAEEGDVGTAPIVHIDSELETSLISNPDEQSGPGLSVNVDDSFLLHPDEALSPTDSASVDTFTWTVKHLSLLKGGNFETGQRLKDLVLNRASTSPGEIVQKQNQKTYSGPGTQPFDFHPGSHGPQLKPFSAKSLKRRLVSKFESLDYDVCENLLYQAEQRGLKARSAWFTVIGRWFIYFLTAVGIALCAFTVDVGIKICAHAKHHIIAQFMEKCTEGENCLYQPLLLWVGMNCAFVLVSCTLVLVLQPEAGGGGVSQVKAFLNGIRMHGLLTFKALIVKVVGTICTLSGGMPNGKEGPLIHIGAIVAARTAYFRYDLCNVEIKSFTYLHTDQERRDITAAGAAAGIGSGFGAPIGGVLFSLEETASFWDSTLTLRVVFMSLIASFFVNILLSAKHGHAHDLSNPGLVVFGRFDNISFELIEVPIFIIIGCLGGIFGAAYVRLSLQINLFRRRYINQHRILRVLEALMVAAVMATGHFILLYFDPSCKPPSHNLEGEHLKMFCPEAQVSSASYLTLGTAEHGLKQLLHAETDYFNYYTLAIYTTFYFVMTCWGTGLVCPGGILIPGLLVGAGWGRMIGMAVMTVFPQPEGNIRKYALIGAACMLGGMLRMVVGLTVMLMECTRDITLGVPLMLCLMITRWVGDLFSAAAYEQDLEVGGIPYIHATPPPFSTLIHATEVMNHPVINFQLIEPVSRVLATMKRVRHNGFPIVEGPSARKSSQMTYGQLRGLILRQQLLFLLKRKCFCNSRGQPVGELPKLSDFRTLFQHELTIDDVKLTEEEMREYYIDMRPYMNPSPYTVLHTVSLPRIFKLFRGLGLRHLVVVSDQNDVIGIVTRKDLARFHSKTKGLKFVLEKKRLEEK